MTWRDTEALNKALVLLRVMGSNVKNLDADYKMQCRDSKHDSLYRVKGLSVLPLHFSLIELDKREMSLVFTKISLDVPEREFLNKVWSSHFVSLFAVFPSFSSISFLASSLALWNGLWRFPELFVLLIRIKELQNMVKWIFDPGIHFWEAHALRWAPKMGAKLLLRMAYTLRSSALLICMSGL